jgi:NAD(P)-dependent dehydrogenase (short-subunit alcohol dehydrogenase family)
MDPVAARRTVAGEPVVHGVHAALWALDVLASQGRLPLVVRHLDVKFWQFIHLDEPVAIDTSALCDDLVITITVQGVRVISVTLSAREPALDVAVPPDTKLIEASEPLSLELAGMKGFTGRLARQTEGLAQAFPSACGHFHVETIADIAALSTLVGMVCPGLHSVFSSFEVALTEPHSSDGLAFRVASANARVRLVSMDVQGARIAGTVEAFNRHPPIEQAGIARIAGVVRHGEFAGAAALIIGGSRGLGALTAKVIAAGGGRVAVTYATGRDDAARVAEEINTHVGSLACTTLPFDVAQAAAPQLASAGEVSHLYHFASPSIFGRRSATFSPDRFLGFVRAYVTSFADLCETLSQAGTLSAFYPSSVAVADDRPEGMTEYAMAKAAGEVLCSELGRRPGLRVVCHRLPRLLTDQTATPILAHSADALDTLLPMIRETQATGR